MVISSFIWISQWSFLWSLMDWDKIWPFLSFMRNTKYCLISNAHTPMFLVMNLIDLLGSFSIRTSIAPVKFLSCQNDQERLPRCSTFVITFGLICSLNAKQCSQIDRQTPWNLCIAASSVNAKKYSVAFASFIRIELHPGFAFLKNWAKLTLSPVS